MPYLKAMIAIATVTQTKMSPIAISQPVPSVLCRIRPSSAAIVAAASVPPIQIGFDSQYKIAVIAPASRPNAIRAHS